MKTNPIFQFNTTTDTGIDEVPETALVIIKDSDGAGTPKQVIKISQGTLTSSSTIQDFLNDLAIYTEFPGGGTIEDINGGTY